MLIVLTAASAVIPSVVIMWYFHRKDINPEPGRVLWKTFGLGILSILPVLAIAIPMDWIVEHGTDNPFLVGLGSAFLAAAIPEELLKFLVVWRYASRHPAFDEPMDGVVYGVVASLGFATLENVMYTMGGGLSTALLRAFTAVPGHAFCGAIMGYYVGQARFGDPARHRALLLAAWLWPTLLHGIYDFPLLTLQRIDLPGDPSGAQVGLGLGLVLITLTALVVEWVWAVKLTRRLHAQQLAGARETAGPQPDLPGPDPGAAASAAGALPAPVAAPAAISFPSPVLSVVLIVLGSLAIVGGSLVGLILALAWGLGQVSSADVGPVLAGGMVLGLLPLGAGIVCLLWGVRRLPPRR